MPASLREGADRGPPQERCRHADGRRTTFDRMPGIRRGAILTLTAIAAGVATSPAGAATVTRIDQGTGPVIRYATASGEIDEVAVGRDTISGAYGFFGGPVGGGPHGGHRVQRTADLMPASAAGLPPA